MATYRANWEQQSAANRESWDRQAHSHLNSWYRLDEFEQGGVILDSLQLAGLGEVAGKRLLHLQCNAGLDTLSWARQGASVTGVDISPQAVAIARDLARRHNNPR